MSRSFDMITPSSCRNRKTLPKRPYTLSRCVEDYPREPAANVQSYRCMSFVKLHRLHFNPRGCLSQARRTHRRLSEPPWKLASRSLLLFKHYNLPTRPYRKEPGHGHSTPNLRAPTLPSKPCTSLCRGPGPILFPPKKRSKCCMEARGFRPSESCLHPSCPGRRELWDPWNPKPEAGCFGLQYGASQCRVKDTLAGSGLDFGSCQGAPNQHPACLHHETDPNSKCFKCRIDPRTLSKCMEDFCPSKLAAGYELQMLPTRVKTGHRAQQHSGMRVEV